MKENIDVYEEQKKLVLARFKTLNPDLKILLGGEKILTVKDLIKAVEQDDDFGRKIVEVQITMLQILTRGYSS